jgi:hypothetical protein
MSLPDDEIRAFSDELTLEILNAIGLPKTTGWLRLFRPVFHASTDRLSTMCVKADRLVASDGFPAAAGWMLTNWCNRVTGRCLATIPTSGPLLVLSNHAGSYDTFVVASQLGREDLKLIASNIAFLKKLPNASNHLIFLSNKTQDRMTAARAGIRTLKKGGSLLLYGTGLVDPDPEVYPGAEAWIEKWQPSIDLFLRTVPGLQVVLSIVSGVVAQRWARHPVTWLRRIDWQKRRLAEFSQVIQQLLFPGRLMLQPHISFSAPFGVADLQAKGTADRFLPAVIARGKVLLADHLEWIRTLPED